MGMRRGRSSEPYTSRHLPTVSLNPLATIVASSRHLWAYWPTSRMSSRLGRSANNRSRHNSAQSRLEKAGVSRGA